MATPSLPMINLPDSQMKMSPQPSTMDKSGSLGAITYGRLQRTNPRLDIKRVLILKALYRGGQSLLGDKDIVREVFPKYVYENPATYEERIRRSYYENMFSLVINQISAGLAQDPARISKNEDETVDDYWTELLENATPKSEDGTGQKTLDQVMRDACVEALVTGWSWIQADMPLPDPNVTTYAEQEAADLLRAYFCLWGTECVTDWEEQKGRLLWVRTYECSVDASDPTRSRDDKLHTWTIWTDKKWFKYKFLQEKGKPMPGENDPIEVAESGDHSFGRVPWTRLDFSIPGGTYLWLGDVIESLCRNYFNRQNGESFQWSQFYYQQLYEYLGPEIPGIDEPIAEAQQDPHRAKRRRAPGEVHVRGAGDKAEFVGPNMAGADVGRNALNDLRDAILRVTQQMALAQDSQGAMLRRSAESKQQDSKGTEILLTAIGRKLMVCMNAAVALLAAGRQDTEDPPKYAGYEKFEISDMSVVLQQALTAQTISIPSATYQVEMLYQVAIAHLGEGIDDEKKQKIREELETQITQDQFVQIPEESDDDPYADPNDTTDPNEGKEFGA